MRRFLISTAYQTCETGRHPTSLARRPDPGLFPSAARHPVIADYMVELVGDTGIELRAEKRNKINK